MLLDEDLILKTIKSRSNLSAFGCDGLCNAFGSVPHKLIKKKLKSLGFNNNFVKCIMSSYKSLSTKIVVNDHKSDEIVFRKGVKQGCPLSPTFFNICLISLVNHLLKQKADDYHWFDDSSVIQAYADDLILFSEVVYVKRCYS